MIEIVWGRVTEICRLSDQAVWRNLSYSKQSVSLVNKPRVRLPTLIILSPSITCTGCQDQSTAANTRQDNNETTASLFSYLLRIRQAKQPKLHGRYTKLQVYCRVTSERGWGADCGHTTTMLQTTSQVKSSRVVIYNHNMKTETKARVSSRIGSCRKVCEKNMCSNVSGGIRART